MPTPRRRHDLRRGGGRRRLADRTGAALDRLSARARHTLERRLLHQLRSLAGPALYAVFQVARLYSAEAAPAADRQAASQPMARPGAARYDAFVEAMLA